MKLQLGQPFVLIRTGEIILMVPKVSIRDLCGRARAAKAAEYRDRRDRF